jgi:hypothetical protein
MTNFSVPDAGTELCPERPALAPTLARSSAPSGGKRRPVKIAHPASRGARARREAPITVFPITVMSLNRAVAATACVRRGAGSTIATTSLEAA